MSIWRGYYTIGGVFMLCNTSYPIYRKLSEIDSIDQEIIYILILNEADNHHNDKSKGIIEKKI